MIAVEDNSTVMKAGAEALLGSGGTRSNTSSSLGRCVSVSSYLEAVGVLACHKAGVNPTCLTPHVPAIRQMAPLLVTGEGVATAAAAAPEGGPREDSSSSSDVAVHSGELRALVDA